MSPSTDWRNGSASLLKVTRSNRVSVTGHPGRVDDADGTPTGTDVPRLVDKHLAGQLPIDHFISHTLRGVEKTNEAIHILESGECLRCVVIY